MPGVYELADMNKSFICSGQSGTDVPNRIRQQFARQGPIRETACDWRYDHSRVPQAEEARLLSQFRSANQGELPSCNTAVPLERDSARRFAERFRG